MRKSVFVRVVCPRCKKTQVIFGKSSTKVRCSACNARLVHTTGGKARIKAWIKEVLPW